MLIQELSVLGKESFIALRKKQFTPAAKRRYMLCFTTAIAIPA